MPRHVLRWAVVIVAAAVIGVAGAGAASAHPTLLFTDPGADSAVAESPPVLTLLFNEPVSLGDHAVVLLDAAGRERPVGAAGTERGGRFVTARPVQPLAPGAYTVRWRVTGSDGDLVESEFRFVVGNAALSSVSEAGAGGTAWAAAGWRWLLFAGFAVAFGESIARRVTATAQSDRADLPRLRAWAPAGIVVALAGVTGLLVAQVRDAGTVAAWHGGAGTILLTEAAGLLVSLPVVLSRWWRWALVPLTAVVVAEGIRSHASASPGGWGAVVTAIHLAAVGAWAGALVHVTRAVTAWRQTRVAVRWVLVPYVRLAVWVVIVVVLSGTVNAVLIVPLSHLFSTGYGRILLVKLGLVAAAATAAVIARRRHRAPEDSGHLAAVLLVEAALLVIVLAAGAVLVSTPPGAVSAAVAPAPARGPVLPLGTLAGQVGVFVTASDGQVLIRLSTPRRGDYYAPEPGQRYGLTAAIDTPPRRLAVRGCGTGCFVAPVSWPAGGAVLTLRVAAAGWTGGTVSLPVSWPAPPAADQLAAAVAATRAAGPITVYEAVTSDTSAPRPDPVPLDLDAGFFVSQEPYADGTAPHIARISAPGAPVRLALGYPAASVTVALTLDDHGRIAEETVTDAKHLVTRRLLYPEPD